ncbi:MAG TPA: ABC transporter ATP-binding protein [Longimicrobiales bacterium]
MSNAIETRGLNYRASRTFALENLNLNVPTGSIYGFLGPNGAGKSTTIRLLLGMARPASGSIELLGKKIPGEIASALSRIGYVPERPHVFPALTIDEAMRMHASFFERWDASWAKRLRDWFALGPDRRISKLSKGETGKLMILLALAQRPDLLILDEPTDGLDPMIRRDVLTASLDYVAETGATVFISSHLIHELERICDWVGVLDHGHLVAEMPLQQFKGGAMRIRVSNPPASAADAPFRLVSRTSEPLGPGETWVVNGWQDDMRQYFDRSGATVREVSDMDLEEVFVEMLRSSRAVTK